MGDGVFQQVANNLRDTSCVQFRRWCRRLHVEAEVDSLGLGAGTHRFHGRLQQFLDASGGQLQMQRTGLNLGQQAQVLYQPRQVKSLPVDGVYSFRCGINQAVPYRLKVSLDVGQGSPQFMGHIGCQVAALAFRLLQTLGHDVEAMGQFPYLGGANGIGPLRKVSPPQPTGRRAQALQRCQRAARHQPYQQRAQGCRANSGP